MPGECLKRVRQLSCLYSIKSILNWRFSFSLASPCLSHCGVWIEDMTLASTTLRFIFKTEGKIETYMIQVECICILFLWTDMRSWVGLNNNPFSMLITNPTSILLIKWLGCLMHFIILAVIIGSGKPICKGLAAWQVLNYVQVHTLIDFLLDLLQKKKL